MRLIIKSMLTLLVVALLGLFTLPLKNGAPLLKWSDIRIPQGARMPELPKLPNIERFNSTGQQDQSSAPITSYKWQDPEGNWHLGDTPPSDLPYETITVDPDTNVVQATTPKPVKAPPVTATVEQPTELPTYSPAMAYDPGKVTEIMDSARNVEKLLQQRKEQQDQLLEAMQ